MYFPAEDSYLLAETVKHYSGEYALEIGVGSGIVLEKLCDGFKIVIGTDIHFNSLVFCLGNSSKAASLVCCDAASALAARFDLIVSNPPYLPQDNFGIADTTIYGGSQGLEVVVHFIQSSLSLLDTNGKILIVLSDLSNLEELDAFAEKSKLTKRIVAKKKIFFETLYVFEISPSF